MNSYIENHKEKLESSKLVQRKFKNFCVGLYETGSLKIEPEEKIEFERLRESEHKDYLFRKNVFWPSWAAGLLVFDQIITMPSSKSNTIRVLFNACIGAPFVGIAVTGLIFYREKVPSHEFALNLCEKYQACEDVTSESE